MRCRECGHNLRSLPTGHCPRCRAWFSTGDELKPLARRLLHPDGRYRCVVCRADLTGITANRCPHCSARYRVAV